MSQTGRKTLFAALSANPGSPAIRRAGTGSSGGIAAKTGSSGGIAAKTRSCAGIPRKKALLAALPLLVLTACDLPPAWGDAHGIIVAATDELWAEVGESFEAVMEPTIFTVRNEKTFRITQQDPRGADWENLQRFVQVVAVGSQEEPWVAEALEKRRGQDPLAPPQILQAENVWARGQLVTILLLPPGGDANAVAALLEPLHDLLDRQYREYAEIRMYTTGRDTALADTLRRTAGFELLLPEVYSWDRKDSVYIFRNDNPDPSELIRQIAVTWRRNADLPIDQESILAWRAGLAGSSYSFDQVAVLDEVEAGPIEARGLEGYQVRAVWENPPDLGWPAAGPFITQALRCPAQDRLYLLDAWLYAPGKDKYEYVLQLETILDSFRCGGGA